MSRRHLTFACERSTLAATLDATTGTTGLLVVSGGNETRAGAWNGQARLGARLAEAGFPVFRFDRRGVGDSEGPNGGFRSSAPDLAAAAAAFRTACPHLTHVVGLGNCDAASALMLSHGAGLDGLILSNPWTIEGEDAPPPPQAIRSHYRKRLADPSAILRLLTGKVSLSSLAASLRSALRPAPPATSLAREMADGIAGFEAPLVFLLAERDRTAQAFVAGWTKNDPRIRTCSGATHSYVEPHARDWLAHEVIALLTSLSTRQPAP